MKTAISLPNRVFKEAERLAKKLKKGRSELYAAAVGEYIARHDPEAVTEEINRLCSSLDTAPDSFVNAAARRTIEDTEW